jgi:hypothetical protein
LLTYLYSNAKTRTKNERRWFFQFHAQGWRIPEKDKVDFKGGGDWVHDGHPVRWDDWEGCIDDGVRETT